jgi:hypothetical protein
MKTNTKLNLYNLILLTLFVSVPLAPAWLISGIHATDYSDIRKRTLDQATEIVSKMSDEEKAGQVIHIAIPKNYLDEVAELLIEKTRNDSQRAAVFVST